MITLEIPAPEFIQRFQSGEIPETAHVTVVYEETGAQRARLFAKLHQWQKETHTQLAPEVSTRELFAQAARENAQMTEEERAAEARQWEQFEQGLNDNRALSGMRTL